MVCKAIQLHCHPQYKVGCLSDIPSPKQVTAQMFVPCTPGTCGNSAAFADYGPCGNRATVCSLHLHSVKGWYGCISPREQLKQPKGKGWV